MISAAEIFFPLMKLLHEGQDWNIEFWNFLVDFEATRSKCHIETFGSFYELCSLKTGLMSISLSISFASARALSNPSVLHFRSHAIVLSMLLDAAESSTAIPQSCLLTYLIWKRMTYQNAKNKINLKFWSSLVVA